MDINLTDETRQLISRWIATGAFCSPEEVIQAGVKHLGPVDARPTMESLREKITEGVRDIEAGRCGPVDIEEVKRGVRERAAQKSSQ